MDKETAEPFFNNFCMDKNGWEQKHPVVEIHADEDEYNQELKEAEDAHRVISYKEGYRKPVDAWAIFEHGICPVVHIRAGAPKENLAKFRNQLKLKRRGFLWEQGDDAWMVVGV